MLIEDSTKGMIAARCAGMKWVGFEGAEVKPDMKYAVYKFSDYRTMTAETLEKCDTVRLMLINPSYAFVKGEKQVAYAERKISDLRKQIVDRCLDTKFDGGYFGENNH